MITDNMTDSKIFGRLNEGEYKMNRKAFDIPAIHNELEALAEHLDIDSDLIEVISKNEFLFNSQSYKVKSGAGGNNGKVVYFNSQLWSVAYK